MSLEVEAQGADLIEHHALTGEKALLDVLLRGGEHSHHIGLGNGGSELDILSQLLEGVVAGFYCTVGGIEHTLLTFGVGALKHLVGNCHSCNGFKGFIMNLINGVSSPLSLPGRTG